MVTLDDAVIARLKKGDKQYEVYVDPDGALSLKRGDEIDIGKILAVEDIFENASRGDRPAEQDIENTFKTQDVFEIARQIILHGEIHLTTEQRKAILEEKKRRIITFIAANAINPQTRTPHPPNRIERAMEEARVHIDPLKSVDEQVTIVMKAIRPIIPIRFEEINIAVRIDMDYAPKSYGSISKFGTLSKEEWQKDGSWIGVVTIPAGMQDDFFGLVNHLTKGTAEIRILK
ncbi:MAG: ribosome assembly factor SBDS [Methanosarcinales archaeon]|nr:ribosome assembly factor SBDS [ANME-2 cluster archaeon]MDF1532320.1 ribosome assembly factor SBDS [ANME-2 cluster archaeon]MDW7775387.1 ribosome assembly factor SBDS [Methanosarcinales archaeon]